MRLHLWSDQSGARASTILIRPRGGSDWTGSFSGDASFRRGFSGLFGTPSPRRLCVVECGTAFLVDVLNPPATTVVQVDGPVRGIEPLVNHGLLLLLTPWTITAVGTSGPLWTTRRIAIEDVRVDEVIDHHLGGVADPDDEEPRNFAIDLRTGEVVGGGGNV
jgi:hypothetical protein